MNRRDTMFTPRTTAAVVALCALMAGAPALAQQQGQQQQGRQQQQEYGQQQQGRQQYQGQQQRRQTQQQQGRQQQMGQAPMEYRQIRGTVQEVRRVNLRGQDKQATLVLLETEQGNRVVADLGTDTQGLRIRQGQELAVRGRPVNIGQQRIILQANAAYAEGRAYDINRPAMYRGGDQQMQQGQQQQRRQQQGQQQQQGRMQQQGMEQDRMQDRQRRQQAMQQEQQGQQQGRQQGGRAGFSQLDRNQDGQLSRQEFIGHARQAGMFEQFDRNQDDQISRREFVSAGYALLDTNNDGQLTVTEWDRGIDRIYGEQAMELDVSDWDANGDDTITRQEFAQGIAQGDLLEQAGLTEGQGLERQDLYDMAFRAADADDDEQISQQEFRSFSRLAMGGGQQQGRQAQQRQGGGEQQ